ncbi:MAG: helix-turn-helix transcriptional regulator [Lachnospiraceae bacterium]|nr:helix-turn-helix transcriptional regulator [Lachnospiraceae bacterium]
MKNIADKLRDARVKLGFSQDYVAKCVGLSRSAVTQIELGNRKINADEITQFCKLYHLSADYLLDSGYSETKQTVFARGFEELNENDQQEILNLIAFKKAMNNR